MEVLSDEEKNSFKIRYTVGGKRKHKWGKNGLKMG
jgi:hypothetical protein